jgi:type IV secretory pathway VirB10-like protein
MPRAVMMKESAVLGFFRTSPLVIAVTILGLAKEAVRERQQRSEEAKVRAQVAPAPKPKAPKVPTAPKPKAKKKAAKPKPPKPRAPRPASSQLAGAEEESYLASERDL